jgi:hypothetical protein
MKNKKSIYLIVVLAILVGVLHFFIKPYQGVFKDFVHGYLIDIMLPMVIYLLLQVSLRNRVTTFWSRIIGAVFTFLIGTSVELFQMKGIPVFGNTYDPLDILMYGIGVTLGIAIDLLILKRLEQSVNH